MPDALDTLTDWIAIDSVTGGEADYADALARKLESLGFATERQDVAPGRFNLLARAGKPEVVFCTHLDTVPPWFGPTRERGLVRGRGSCDAKGPALAMALAAKQLLDAGEERVGFLFTVGEEIDSVGAQRANALLDDPRRAVDWKPRWTIVGEPTENRFVGGHKGIFKASLCAHGVAGHSSQDVGPSAIHELVSCAARLLASDWGRDAHFGAGTLNLGQIEGGVAANVVAESARAELLIRTVEPVDVTLARVRAALGEHVELLDAAKNYAPVPFHVPEGAEGGEVVAFGTDAPHMPDWGEKLLYGPGRILDAHTDHEYVEVESFERAVAEYARTATGLLAKLDAEGERS